MLKNVKVFFALGAFAVVLVCASSSFAQRPILGGYKKADPESAAVVAAGKFAVEAQNEKDESERTFEKVVSAETQVVAGINYRMCVEFTNADDETAWAKVVVNQDLKKAYKLTSWTMEDCGASEESAKAKPPVAGGYSKADTLATDVMAAADFAAAEQNKKDDNNLRVVAVKKAEKQVVAGMNYRLCIEVQTGGDEGEKYFAQTTVYQNLQQAYSLSSWSKAASCGK